MNLREYKMMYNNLLLRCTLLHNKIKEALQEANKNTFNNEVLEQDGSVEAKERWDPIKDQLDALHDRVKQAELLKNDINEMTIVLEDIWDDLLKLSKTSWLDRDPFLDKYWIEFLFIIIEISKLYNNPNDGRNIYDEVDQFYQTFKSKLSTLWSGYSYKSYPNPCVIWETVLIDVVNQDLRKDEFSAGDLLHSFMPLLDEFEYMNNTTLNSISKLDVNKIINEFNVTNYIWPNIPLAIQDKVWIMVFDVIWNQLYQWNAYMQGWQQSTWIDLWNNITSNFVSWVNIIKIEWYNKPFTIIAQ